MYLATKERHSPAIPSQHLPMHPSWAGYPATTGSMAAIKKTLLNRIIFNFKTSTVGSVVN